MRKHSKHNCIILKDGVNEPGLAFDGKVGLGPFWTLVQVLLYHDVVHVSVSSSVSSFRHTSSLLAFTRLSDRPTLPLDQGVGSSGAEDFVLARLCLV
jgi:hypothetical protein